MPFFWGGCPDGHDFEFHVFSWMEVLGQWKLGIVYPGWAALAHWGYGEARYLFYPPASWTLGAALGAALPWKMVPGTYCWIALMLAGAAMYRLAREWLPAPGALFAAVLYALNPYHLLIVYWRSAYAELLAAVLLPLLLLCLLRLGHLPPNQLGLRPTLCLSATLAAAWLTNIPAAVMIHYSAAGLALVMVATGAAAGGARQRSSQERSSQDRSWQERSSQERSSQDLSSQERSSQDLSSQDLSSHDLLPQKPSWAAANWRLLIRISMAMLLGAGLASFYLLPAIHEQSWIDIGQAFSPGVRPQDNFLFTTIDDPDHNRFNLAVSILALAEIGVLVLAIWFSRTKKHPETAGDQSPWILLSAWGAGSALLMLSVTNVLWLHIPKLRFVQLPFRWLLPMNAALAILLALAAQRRTARAILSTALLGAWMSRAVLFAILLSAVIFADYRISPPWWNTSADIREMSAAITSGSGYEGTDEYVPAGADPYELNQSLPRVSDETGALVPSEVLAWGPTEKHFAVNLPAAQNLTVRLFSYPAWEVIVNGRPVQTQKTAVTELIVIPLAAGANDVHIYFRRTIDRYAGDIISLISLAVFVVAWMKTRAPNRRPANPSPAI